MKVICKARTTSAIAATRETEACGTDSEFRPDARRNLSFQIEQARQHFQGLNDNLGKHYTGFNVYRNGVVIQGRPLEF